ncbi:MAG: hypothetical protein ACE5GD_01740 [Candidatus Geothermarchaeales archaeon]
MDVNKKSNIRRVEEYFRGELEKIGYEGVIGVADFSGVYHGLMPAQKARLEKISGDRFQDFLENGSIVCIGIAYPEHAIDCINVESGGMIDKDAWNVYAREYHEINGLLNAISKKMADRFGGIPVPATLEGITNEVGNVEEYYGMTISHRVVAEEAGLGWRGKNELILNDRYSCALRFASIITSLPLTRGEPSKASCGACTACLEVCPFLEKKEELKNYRENCRRFINALGLEWDVCGKCIKACYRRGIFKDEFKLRS